MNKPIVADSSAIISLAVNCMSSVLAELSAKIVVTGGIYDEIVSRPITSKRYALESLRIRRLFSEGVISVRDPVAGATSDILGISNSIYRVKKHPLRLIHEGEAEALAVMREVGSDVLLIDERTTRMIIENAEQLRQILSQQINRRVDMDYEMLMSFKDLVGDVQVIRSSEVAAVAYEKGLLQKSLGTDGKEALAAMLYALKFSGCAIAWREIEEYLSMM